MVLHLVRIHAEYPERVSLDDIQSSVSTWVDRHTPWAKHPTPHEVRPVSAGDTPAEGTEYLLGDFRFEYGSGDRLPLITDIESELQTVCSWYRLAYHVCTHDSQYPGTCGWDEVRDYGDVPADIPTYDTTSGQGAE